MRPLVKQATTEDEAVRQRLAEGWFWHSTFWGSAYDRIESMVSLDVKRSVILCVHFPHDRMPLKFTESSLPNSFQQPPEGPLTEGPSTQDNHPDHGRVFTTEATIKSKHFTRKELILREEHICSARVADGQTAASWGEGKKDCKHSP